MPAELFVQSLTPEIRRARSRWTLAGSLCAHAALIAILVAVPIVAGARLPVVGDRLSLFVMAAVPPPTPPPPASAPPRALPPDINPDAAPTVAAGHVAGEPISAATAGAGVPGALAPVAAAGVPGGALPASPPVMFGPPPPSKDPIRIGGDIKAPTRLSYAPPIYPPIAIQAKVDGTVVLEATIDEHGVVKDLRVVRSIPLLDRAAIDAVAKWRFTPTRLNGVAVSVLMTVQVTFTLR